MEPKAKTMQEKFGFSDPDLKTPKHDAIMMWLDGEMERIATEKAKHSREWKFRVLPEGDARIYGESANSLIDGMKNDIVLQLDCGATPTPQIVKVWEKPIVDRTFTIGFADMFVGLIVPCIECLFERYSDPPRFLNAGVFDATVWQAYFEVKPSIPSVGELVRQLRMYQTYTGQTPWFVVSPDARFEDILKAQGFGFVKVPALP